MSFDSSEDGEIAFSWSSEDEQNMNLKTWKLAKVFQAKEKTWSKFQEIECGEREVQQFGLVGGKGD